MLRASLIRRIVPPNISRKILQQNEILRVMKKILAKKYLEMFADFAEKKDDYKKFYEQFGKCLELGIHENSINGTWIAELLSFNTSKSGDEQISLKEYVDQNDILLDHRREHRRRVLFSVHGKFVQERS